MTAKGGGRDGSPDGLVSLRNGDLHELDGEDLARALREALDFRGDVTLALADGTRVTGYIFDLAGDRARPDVRLYPAQADAPPATIPGASVRGIAFSGRDTADGRSWEAWVRRHQEKKRLLEQGVDIGDIEPHCEPL